MLELLSPGDTFTTPEMLRRDANEHKTVWLVVKHTTDFQRRGHTAVVTLRSGSLTLKNNDMIVVPVVIEGTCRQKYVS